LISKSNFVHLLNTSTGPALYSSLVSDLNLLFVLMFKIRKITDVVFYGEFTLMSILK